MQESQFRNIIARGLRFTHLGVCISLLAALELVVSATYKQYILAY